MAYTPYRRNTRLLQKLWSDNQVPPLKRALTYMYKTLFSTLRAEVAELVDALDSKSSGRKAVSVRARPSVCTVSPLTGSRRLPL